MVERTKNKGEKCECGCGCEKCAGIHKKDFSYYAGKRGYHKSAGNGAVYGLGFVGSLVYYWVNATTFWMIVLGLLKAVVWPAIFVYYIFDFLKL